MWFLLEGILTIVSLYSINKFYLKGEYPGGNQIWFGEGFPPTIRIFRILLIGIGILAILTIVFGLVEKIFPVLFIMFGVQYLLNGIAHWMYKRQSKFYLLDFSATAFCIILCIVGVVTL